VERKRKEGPWPPTPSAIRPRCRSRTLVFPLVLGGEENDRKRKEGGRKRGEFLRGQPSLLVIFCHLLSSHLVILRDKEGQRDSGRKKRNRGTQGTRKRRSIASASAACLWRLRSRSFARRRKREGGEGRLPCASAHSTRSGRDVAPAPVISAANDYVEGKEVGLIW